MIEVGILTDPMNHIVILIENKGGGFSSRGA
jgi:hypothetical protein